MTTRDVIRVQVEDLRGNCQVVTVDQCVDDEARAVVEEWLTDTAAELGQHPENVALWAVAELVQRHHDRKAYEREAARRGVLAL